MNDLISRRAAIDAIGILLEQSEDDERDKIWNNAIRGSINVVKHHLQSAQPEPCEDAVSRADVVDMLEMYPFTEYSEYEAAREVVKRLPSAQPDIIRCKECRYYEWMSNRVPDEQTWFCHNWNAETGKDDFCSYAERRE